jgi:hypothetical protein
VEASDPSLIGLWLQLCLRLAADVTAAQGTTPDAQAAKAGCSEAAERIKITFAHVHGMYKASASGVPQPPSRPSPLIVTCRRHGVGLTVSMKPRSRHATLSGLGANMIAAGFVNKTQATVGVHTTFKVN